MGRLACVDLPQFPLQLVHKRHPEWAGQPTVVVAEDKPNAKILWACENARQAGVLPGQRYAHGLSLTRHLRADVVSDAHVDSELARLTELLRNHAPEVDCRGSGQSGAPGVFWIGLSGLGRLEPSLKAWAKKVRKALTAEGLVCRIVIGYSRFSTYAVVRTTRSPLIIFDTQEGERAACADVPLSRLEIDPELRDVLGKLGIVTIGEMSGLPPGGLLTRFGRGAEVLYQLANQSVWDPLRPRPVVESWERTILLDDAISNHEQLRFVIRRDLDALLADLADAKLALRALIIELLIDGRSRDEPIYEFIRPAEPTLDGRRLLRLLGLRLESLSTGRGVVEVMLSAVAVRATHEQLSLFAEKPNRDPRAANQALAHLRAQYGNECVVRAAIKSGHLPEAKFEWQVVENVEFPKLQESEGRSGGSQVKLVRRILQRPVRLRSPPRNVRDDGWELYTDAGAVTQLDGPYIVSGGWWNRPQAFGAGSIHREYHYAQTDRGACLWVYYDRRRRAWFLHGTVE